MFLACSDENKTQLNFSYETKTSKKEGYESLNMFLEVNMEAHATEHRLFNTLRGNLAVNLPSSIWHRVILFSSSQELQAY